MLETLWWLVLAELVGLAAFPIAYRLLPGLADRGYSVSKPLGLLLLGYVTWLLGALGLVPIVRATLWVFLLLMLALSGWLAYRQARSLKEFLRRRRRELLFIEGVFLLFFLGWTVYRAYDPAITGTEKPMDFAFLNASMRADLGQPEDPWLRGHTISYYYFGYWMMGVMGELSGVYPAVAYNLALSLVAAMAAAAVAGLVFNMVSGDRLRGRLFLAMGGAVLLFGVVGNLEGVLEFARANGMGGEGFYRWVGIKDLDPPGEALTQTWRPTDFWWWWRASRVINTYDGSRWVDTTIQEFPFFSFMLGDLHPHLMALPFALLYLSLALDLLRRRRWWPLEWRPGEAWRERALALLPYALASVALAGLAFTNMWDLPTYWATLAAVLFLRAYREEGGIGGALRRAVPLAAAVLGGAMLLLVPYLLDFTSQVSGIRPVPVVTRPLHMFLVWGLLAAAVAPFVLGLFWGTTVDERWGRETVVALAVGFLPFVAWAFLHLQEGGDSGQVLGRLFHILPLGLMVSIAVYTLLWRSRATNSPGVAYALLLAALGFLLILGPELLYVRDVFDNRMNTVFKLYYQAWTLLAVAGGFGIYYWSHLRRTVPALRPVTTLWAGLFVVLLAGALYYPPSAAASKASFGAEATLDGLAFIERFNPDEYQAIRFLMEEADGDAAVLEAVGGDYSDYGRFASSTGVPTVVNWEGHQIQWRGSRRPFEGRAQDVARIYQTADVEEARNLLERYGVEYVVVGPRERASYGDEGLAKFATFMEPVFTSGTITIYRMRGSR